MNGPIEQIPDDQGQAAQPTVEVTTELVADGIASVAPEGAQNPTANQTQGKSIFLFADGTGNSSAKLFKTNVWRMYEALDLGHAEPGQCVQIAYYDNGVGTSNFRPLRLLGGIFGIGLKANVLRLYQFLCRNWQPGDRIYAFGFSRGAFTIRLLVHLIVDQGIVRHPDPPHYLMKDAYRHVCRNLRPNRWPRWLARAIKALRDGVVWLKRKLMFQMLYKDVERTDAKVEFVGVWDTVAAYGGPIAEITRGIDDWVYPLTMPNYGLSSKVRKARHALSLDDERDAFQPLLWDEYDEKLKLDAGEVDKDRLKQVWFSGVHSDVGGGYPDESLSYISLLWMMDELSDQPDDHDCPMERAKADPAEQPRHVRFIPRFVNQARALANPFGPIHDSRSGFAAYYRYQPRKIAAMTDPADRRYRSLRDPEIGRVPRTLAKEWSDEQKRRWKVHGLLRSVLVHDSAVARIMSGIDSYAPAALPANFEIVPSNGPRARAPLTAADYDKLREARSREEQRAERQERAWNWVWWRRVTYFATVAMSLLLLFLPIHSLLDWIDALCSDDRCFARTILDLPSFLLPGAAQSLWDSYLQKPFALIIGLVLVALLMGLGEFAERRFRGNVRTIWKETLDGVPEAEPAAPATGLSRRWKALRAYVTAELQEFREDPAYQGILHWLKWRFLPLIAGVSLLLLLLIAGAIVVTQTTYAFIEPRQAFCDDRTDRQGAERTVQPVPFEADQPCTDLKVNVQPRHWYKIELTDVKDWRDGGNPSAVTSWLDGQGIDVGSFPATPENGITESSPLLAWAWPFNRVTSANYFEPLTEVRTHDLPGWGRVREWVLGPDIDIRTTDFIQTAGGYQTFFCTERSGHLYLMLNDAGFAYANNTGTALVTVEPVGPVEHGAKCPDRERAGKAR